MTHIEPIELPEDEPLLPSESLFCESYPNLPRAWDSTMLGLLKTCPRKFYYTIILGYQSNGFAAHLSFGIAYHKALEQFDKDIFDGIPRAQAINNAIRFCLSYGYRDDLGRFRPYDAQYTAEPTKTRDTLVRAVVWYLDHFKDDPAKTFQRSNGAPAVELSFKINLSDFLTPDGSPFLLCGHLDRVVELDDKLYWMDRKTTKGALDSRYFRTFTPSNQMSLYNAASQILLGVPMAGGLIDACQIGVNFTRYARHPIHRTRGQMDEWYADTKFWIGQAIDHAVADYWPQNDTRCGDFGGCPFIGICSKDPKVRTGFLEHSGFIERKWNPLESR